MYIVHAADIHLGRRRLGDKLPDSDFADALADIVYVAVREQADVFVIAGDLFDSARIEPPHLQQAIRCLRPLKEVNIPVVAIEGNHDKVSMHSVTPSWIRYLSDEGYLHLLTTTFTPDGPVLNPWDEQTRTGSWIDIGGVRFLGAGYLGAGTPKRTRAILGAMESELPLVMLLHAGPEYFVGDGGGFDDADLEFIRERVCYLALGHIHKPMLYGGWACNPGSPENWRLQEARYDFDDEGQPQARGFARVEIDPKQPSQPSSLQVASNRRRPVKHLELDCETLLSDATDLDSHDRLVTAARELIAAADVNPETVVILQLIGAFDIESVAFEPERLSRELMADIPAALIHVSTDRLALYSKVGQLDSETAVKFDRQQAEQEALLQLLEADPLWGPDSPTDEIAALFTTLKEQVRNNTAADQIADDIMNHPLIDFVSDRLPQDRAVTHSETKDK